MRLKNLDLLVTILIVALNVGWVQFPGRPVIVGIILALPFVLILPGYTATQMLFRKRSPGEGSDQAAKPSHSLRLGHPIGNADQLILSLGLSMAIDILVGFVLNILPIGLQPLSWTLSLGLLTVLFAVLAMFVRRKDVLATEKTPRPHITLLDLLFFGIAIFIMVNAIWLAAIRPLVPQPSFTQFWMLPANQAVKECAVSIGIQSSEVTSVKYTLRVMVNNQQVAGNWSTIVLAPQQQWAQIVPVTPEAQNNLRIEAQLYRADRPGSVYRDVYLTFHVSESLQNGQFQQRCTREA